ncbi:YfaZ family outer membrane protein [Dyella choica]|nr:YfaZ family outer membrane protein [Dyella choica]
MMSSTAFAVDLSLSGGDGSVAGSLGGRVIPGLLRADLGYLHTGRGDGNADVYSGDLLLSPALPIFHPQVGVRYQYQDSRYGRGGGLGFGGSLFLGVLPRLQLGVFGFYTPGKSTTGNLRRSVDYGAQAKLHVVRSLYVSAGYRILRSRFEGGGEHDLYRGPAFSVELGL